MTMTAQPKLRTIARPQRRQSRRSGEDRFVKQRIPKKFLESLVSFFKPSRIILFGSAARGEAGPDSDIDLVIVVDDDTPPEKISWRAVDEARRDYHRPIDIIACRESLFRRRSGTIGSLAHTVLAEGRVLYERT